MLLLNDNCFISKYETNGNNSQMSFVSHIPAALPVFQQIVFKEQLLFLEMPFKVNL